MRCHYEVLGVPITASLDEIKKAYRKAALLWHPDKHGDSPNKEEINKKFLEVQDAYETLSSDQERAWYDAHREVLINGGTPGDPSDAAYLFNVYPYFSSSCFQGFGDDDRGFYSVYRGVFAHIAEEDRNHYESETEIPEFGDSTSDYDAVVGPFYSFWSSYCTPRSFVWMEKHDTREAGERYVRRAMEKENKKLRDKAKKERNEEIRRLVEFVRKKDKRVEQYKKVLEERAQLAQQKAKEKKEADRLRRQEQMKNYVEPEWSTVDHMLEQLDLEEEKQRRNKKKQARKEEDNEESDEQSPERQDDVGNDEDSAAKIELEDDAVADNDDIEFDEDDEEDALFCIACNKSFKSAKSFQNHEKSKKHKENVEILKRHMNEEDAAMFSPNKDENNSEPEQDEGGATRQKLSKKQKKKRRQNKNLNDSSDNEEAATAAAQDDSQVESKPIEVDEEPETKVKEKPRSVSKVAEPEAPKTTNCSVCGEEFDTRNKLFDHIKQEGHAAPKPQDGPMSHNALKKNKRMAKAQKK